MFGDSIYLTAGTHVIFYNANQGGQWTRLDAFHLYYDDTRAVTDAIIFEAEENNVNQTAIYNAYDASGGKFVRTNSNNWTWDFTPEINGNYRFEAIGNGDNCTENGSFKVGDTTLWTGVWNTTPSWSCTGAHALVQELGGSIYLTGGTTYKLTLVPRGTTAKTIAIDYLKIYTDDMADDTAMLNTKVSESSLYGVDVIGYGADGATATVTVNETHNGKAMSVTTNAVSLNGGETSTTTDKVGIFYMDEGDKIVSVNVTGDYTVEKISVYKMLNVKTNAGIIEAEKYETSSTPAFTAKYGDYTSSVYNSGLYGSNITATYSFTATSNQTYRFDVIGAADSTASNVALTINGNSINGVVRSGDWKTKQNYIGDFELTAGTYSAVVDVTDWYAAVIHNANGGGGETWTSWLALEDGSVGGYGSIKELAVIAGVYDGDDLVNAYFSNTINRTVNESNSKLYDYKITVNDIAVKDGQIVKLFVLDNGTMTPLVDYTTYR